MAGQVQTVLGNVAPEKMGQVLMHEHLLVDARPLSVPAPKFAPKDVDTLPFDFPNLGHIRLYPYSHTENLKCFSDDVAVHELEWFREVGGGTIVDVTTRGIGVDEGVQNGLRLAELSKRTGVHIVCGAGFYVGSTHPTHLAEASVEAIAEEIAREVTEGVGGSAVRAGIIGEIGLSYPIKPGEKKVLCASAIAQRRTGAALMIHPGRNEDTPQEIVDILREAGADLSRVVIAHIDRTIFSPATLTRLAATGVVIELDLFGNEVSYYQLNETVWMRNDEQRIEMVLALLAQNARVLLSHDIHTRHRMRSFGGHGYGYILENIVPRLLLRGVAPERIRYMLEDLPRELLTLVPPQP